MHMRAFLLLLLLRVSPKRIQPPFIHDENSKLTILLGLFLNKKVQMLRIIKATILIDLSHSYKRIDLLD